jgi:hypothetical protein
VELGLYSAQSVGSIPLGDAGWRGGEELGGQSGKHILLPTPLHYQQLLFAAGSTAASQRSGKSGKNLLHLAGK